MGRIVVEKHINAPVDLVFARLTDLESWPETVEGITRIEKLTEGPVRNGTRFTETRVMFGKEHSETMTFGDVLPNRGYTLTASSCGMLYESVHSLAAEGAGTHLRMEMTSTPISLGAKIIAPIMGVLLKGTMKKMIAKDLDDIARGCESGPDGSKEWGRGDSNPGPAD